MLVRLLEALERQQTGGNFTFSVVVADNDSAQSAKPVLEEFSRKSFLELTYCAEPRQNIALARNHALAHSIGSFVAFIDDDEIPSPEWLAMLLSTCQEHKVDGVLGPVRPYFEEPPPDWIIRGGFCERPEHETGTKMNWDQCRTGNVLFRKKILDGFSEPFKAEFGTGGEDMDFFMRMTQRGCVFIWCNEAVAFEVVPPSRCRRTYMLKRALLRGKNILKHSSGVWRFIAVSLAAVPLYLLFLPITIILGHHCFMKYCIKLCDHAGRLLAVLGLNPVAEREM